MSNDKKTITEPTAEDEALLNDIISNNPETVYLRGRRVKLYWLKPGTQRKITEVMLRKGNDSKCSCQCAAAILLNSWVKIGLLWWIVWRWMYYVKEYSDAELLPLLEAAKKKVPVEEYFKATIYLTVLRDTIMTMTKEEARHILQEPAGGKGGS